MTAEFVLEAGTNGIRRSQQTGCRVVCHQLSVLMTHSSSRLMDAIASFFVLQWTAPRYTDIADTVEPSVHWPSGQMLIPIPP